jgi:hypothetical protein
MGLLIEDIPIVLAEDMPEGTMIVVDSKDYTKVLITITNIGTSKENDG